MPLSRRRRFGLQQRCATARRAARCICIGRGEPFDVDSGIYGPFPNGMPNHNSFHCPSINRRKRNEKAAEKCFCFGLVLICLPSFRCSIFRSFRRHIIFSAASNWFGHRLLRSAALPNRLGARFIAALHRLRNRGESRMLGAPKGNRELAEESAIVDGRSSLVRR